MNKKKIIALGGVILAIIAVVGLGFLANKDDVVISGKDSEAINEIVENNEPAKQIGREKYKAYRRLGIAPQTHKL